MGALQNVFILQVAKVVVIIELDTAKGRDGPPALILSSAECGFYLCSWVSNFPWGSKTGRPFTDYISKILRGVCAVLPVCHGCWAIAMEELREETTASCFCLKAVALSFCYVTPTFASAARSLRKCRSKTRMQLLLSWQLPG